MREMEEMTAAQISNAKGIRFLVVCEKKSGKFVRRVTEDGEIKLNKDQEVVEVWAKDPSIAAFTDLMNRALDKPKAQEQGINLNMPATEAMLARLKEGRKRVSSAKCG